MKLSIQIEFCLNKNKDKIKNTLSAQNKAIKNKFNHFNQTFTTVSKFISTAISKQQSTIYQAFNFQAQILH